MALAAAVEGEALLHEVGALGHGEGGSQEGEGAAPVGASWRPTGRPWRSLRSADLAQPQLLEGSGGRRGAVEEGDARPRRAGPGPRAARAPRLRPVASEHRTCSAGEGARTSSGFSRSEGWRAGRPHPPPAARSRLSASSASTTTGRPEAVRRAQHRRPVLGLELERFEQALRSGWRRTTRSRERNIAKRMPSAPILNAASIMRSAVVRRAAVGGARAREQERGRARSHLARAQAQHGRSSHRPHPTMPSPRAAAVQGRRRRGPSWAFQRGDRRDVLGMGGREGEGVVGGGARGP